MTLSPEQLRNVEAPLWFCLKAQPKHEHLAAAALRQLMHIDCFCPRIRFRKTTQRGPVWFVEAMFPGYLFARFDFANQHRQVQHAPGVATIVRFGESVAVLDDATMLGLKEASGGQEVVVFAPEIRIGDSVKIAEGAFQGLEAVVTQLLPAKDRVRVLLEFLGRSVEAEVSVPKVLPTISPRAGAFGRANGE